MPLRAPTLDDLRRHAVARSLFKPTTLGRAIARLGFVQADPLRAPARAQDLTLRHRVAGYRAGDLERRYRRLAIEEDCLVNYGFVPRALVPLLHPRVPRRPWDDATRARAQELLAFVRARGPTHPREVAAAFDHGRMQGYWGETLNASTHLLDGLHYRGLLRVAWRERGTRVYEAVDHAPVDDSPAERLARAKALVDIVIAKYAPLPSPSLAPLVRMLRYGAPQLEAALPLALDEARRTLPRERVDGVDWFWPDGEHPASRRWQPDDRVRLLAPFDPVVWDRRRFELLWGWAYRFEAYTPAARRRLGHYALPLLWRDAVIGWATFAMVGGRPVPRFGYVAGRAPRDAVYRRELEAEMARLAAFLGHDTEA